MDKKEQILHYHRVDGLSLREIARRTGLNRKTVTRYSKPKDDFIKQYYEPGEECEFDWGEVKLRIGGRPVTFTMAVFALCHSEGRRTYLFRHQDNLAFMESHPYPTILQGSLSSCSSTRRRYASTTPRTSGWQSMSAATPLAHGRLTSTTT